MLDEKTESTDNQGDSATEETTATETQEVKETEETKEGATTETEKPEFEDKNMQSKFTQRMQELSEKEKTYASGTQKAQAFEQLRNDPEAWKMIVDLYNQRSGKSQKDEPITQDDLDNATTDPKSFETLVDKRARALLTPMQQKVLQLEERDRQRSQLQDIDDFANAKDDKGNLRHPNFWDEGVQTKIKANLQALKGSQYSGLQQVEIAHTMATRGTLEKNAIDKAHSIVNQKKAAVGEKGTRVPSIPNMKGKSMLERATILAKEIGMDVP